MTGTIEVDADDSGTVRLADPATPLPHGRALLMRQTDTMRNSQLPPARSKMVITDSGLSFFPANGRVLTAEMVKATQHDQIDWGRASFRRLFIWRRQGKPRTSHC